MNAHQRRKHARAKLLDMDKREPGTWQASKTPCLRRRLTWAADWADYRFSLGPADPAYLSRGY